MATYMRLPFLSLLYFLLAGHSLTAQIINGQDTLYGNEWINYDQSYFKIMVAEDGMYRLPYQVMADAGIPVSQVDGSRYQLFHNGEELPIYTTTASPFSDGDYLEFYGQKNTSELDRHLFKDPEADMMNPLYSLFTDTAAYFLTWKLNGAGKRYEAVVNDLGNVPAKEEYCFFKVQQVFSNNHDKKKTSDGVSNSFFEIAEGFAGNYVLNNSISLNPTMAYVGNEEAKLTVRFACGNGSHQQVISINSQVIGTESFEGYGVKNQSIPLANNIVQNTINIKLEGTASTTDRSRIAYALLDYPRLFDFSNATYFLFETKPSPSKQYLEISNFNVSNGTPIVYDLTNNLRVEATVENNLIKIALPASSSKRILALFNNTSGIKNIVAVQATQFRNFFQEQGNYIILSNPKLYDDGNGVNWVQEYADYRASTIGGGYETIVIDVQEVYDQFGWGINRHSLSIRNFSHFIFKNWTEPKYLFLLGKGREYNGVRTASSLNNPSALPLLVPTFGVPGSDNLLTASPWSIKPTIPISRLAAATPGEVKLYLDKIKAFEANLNLPQTIADKQWMKRVMHMGGGAPNEVPIIRAHLESMEQLIEGGDFGAQVFPFYKSSADPIQVSQTELITELINGGVGMMTFFGHASAVGFDFTVDDPATYLNKDKYPLIISMGCYSGHIHGASQGVNERFVFQENKGAIGFMATNGFGYIHALSHFMNNYYGKLSGDSYGNSLADILQKCIGEVQATDFGTYVLAQQFTLHGDPALILNGFPAPDYMVDAASVKIAGEKITAQQPSFSFSFTVANLGKAVSDSLAVEISRELPNGSTLLVERRRIPSPKFESSLSFTVPVLGNRAVGFNKMHVRLDPDDLLPEAFLPEAENNNFLISPSGEQGFRFYVFANGALPIYPENFAIVAQPSPVLKAVTSDVFAPKQRYFIELDTTELFDSPLKKTTIVEQAGGVIEWQPDNIAWSDGRVYYWRISPDTLDSQDFTWSNSSFVYLGGSAPGWNQSHFFQLKKDIFLETELPDSTRRLKFLDDIKVVRIFGGLFPTYYTQFFFGEEYYYNPGNVGGGVFVFVFDSITVKTWQNAPPGLFGSQLGGSITTAVFPFETQSPEGREKLIHFLRDTVPDGNYVLLSTIQGSNGVNYQPEEWEADSLLFGTNLFQIVEQQGAKLLRGTATTGALPYAVAYKKNDPGFPVEEAMGNMTTVFEPNFGLPGFWFAGSVESVPVGPSERWDSLAWKTSEFEPDFDRQQLDVFGIKADSSQTLLFENVHATSLDLTTVNAQEFPFLKLRFAATDSMFRTPPQLDFWRVFYKGLPDAAVHPAGHFSFHRDTLQEGENLRFETAVRNLTPLGMDSLLVKYSIVNEQNQVVEQFNRLAPLTAEGQLLADFQRSTKGLRGRQQLWLEVNPNLDQPELHHFNNVAIREFFVETDRRNPLLDVTFDGIRILDGDLVSARPHIVINLQDENPYLALNDTSLFKVFLQCPDSNGLVYVPFDGQILQFTPANPSNLGEKNTAKLDFYPHFTADGNYTLLVQSKDASNNNAGAYDFKVSFQVITKSMISYLLNYPNPFSTATRFVYTLTGEEPPAQFKIQILTISGRIVREITQQEIGQLRIGTHQTDFAWDGTDEFGDRLANGVYLYRVHARKANGEELEMMENGGIDKYFKNGYGKMVIVR